MSYSDMIKNSVLEGFSYADMSTAKIMVTLIITFMIGIYIFFVYKMVTKSAFYFKSFNISMAIISVVTAGIILAMQSSIVISLGMVGALSIVRFRTAIKDPMDLLPVKISPYLLIINTDDKECEDEIMETIHQMAKAYKIKSKNITKSGMDLIIELRTRQEKELINQISELKCITSVSLLAHDGEVKA